MIIDNFKEHFKKPSCSCGKNPAFAASRKLKPYVLRNVTYSFAPPPQPQVNFALGDSNGIVAEAFDLTFADPLSGGPELRAYLQHNYIMVNWFNYQVVLDVGEPESEFYRQLAQPFFI